MIDPDDVQLQIKKKARRRLVGAVAFAGFAALVLPMVMDQEPAPPAQEVEIRIPGQDEKPFQPYLAAVPVPQETPAAASAPAADPAPAALPPAPSPAGLPPAPSAPAAVVPSPSPAGKSEPAPQAVARVVETVPAGAAAAKPQAKPESRTEPRPEPKPAPKVEAKPAKVDEAERAAAILAGKSAEPAPAAAAAGPHVILIGAFANEANVKNIRTKLGELGIKVYTEPLDSPQGRKTRVRAGPFPSREAAEKALEKMKRIGVSGVVAAK
ncbi:SPOR domain-containing protein [Azovibrio restrictus]|uniref:SPOR domain-containing protein n=1 Tax=Azovibrio restrictus TaxID=146938 RepID=UPI0026ED8199|nr:SPOR domain-containing protein [Azovibrio restrictus]